MKKEKTKIAQSHTNKLNALSHFNLLVKGIRSVLPEILVSLFLLAVTPVILAGRSRLRVVSQTRILALATINKFCSCVYACVCVCNRTDPNRKPASANVRAAEWNAWLGRKHVRYTNTYIHTYPVLIGVLILPPTGAPRTCTDLPSDISGGVCELLRRLPKS